MGCYVRRVLLRCPLPPTCGVSEEEQIRTGRSHGSLSLLQLYAFGNSNTPGHPFERIDQEQQQ